MNITVEDCEGIAILTLSEGENRLSPQWLETVNAHLTDIETSASGLITIGDGKFFSNGLDVDWLDAHADRRDWYFREVECLLDRILTFPLPTMAAVNGHAFGAGAMIATAHDNRIMRTDRGFYCFPEVDIGIPFTTGMAALLQAKLSPQAAITAMTTGHRYTATEALDAGLIDATAPLAELLQEATTMLSPSIGKDRTTLSAIKTTMFASVSSALRSAGA